MASDTHSSIRKLQKDSIRSEERNCNVSHIQGMSIGEDQRVKSQLGDEAEGQLNCRSSGREG
jgi:hypothetical protein